MPKKIKLPEGVKKYFDRKKLPARDPREVRAARDANLVKLGYIDVSEDDGRPRLTLNGEGGESITGVTENGLKFTARTLTREERAANVEQAMKNADKGLTPAVTEAMLRAPKPRGGPN